MVIEKPRTAADFTSNWKTPDNVEEMREGNKNIPDAYTRQNRLVEQTLNACLITHIYEAINKGRGLSALAHLLPKKFSKEELAELKSKSKDIQLAELAEMVENPNNEYRLQNHRLHVYENEWSAFNKRMAAYEAQVEAGVNHNTDRIDGDKHRPPLMDIPIDPRIKKMDEDLAETITLRSSGVKTRSSIENKIRIKENKRSGEGKTSSAEDEIIIRRNIKDVNRVEVLPKTPEYAETFIEVMKLLNKPKTVGKTGHKEEISRIFVEQPEIFENGYYNQKLFIAMDRAKDGGKITPDNSAAIAEIKIVPQNMLVADKLSATVKGVLNKLETISDYAKENAPVDNKMLNKRAGLEAAYNFQKHIFEELNTKYNKGYYFPDFIADDKLNDPKEYKKFRAELVKFSQRIHADAIVQDKSWHMQYLKTGILQQESDKSTEAKDKINARLESDLPRSNKVPYLNEIIIAGRYATAHKLTQEIFSDLKIEISPQRKR